MSRVVVAAVVVERKVVGCVLRVTSEGTVVVGTLLLNVPESVVIVVVIVPVRGRLDVVEVSSVTDVVKGDNDVSPSVEMGVIPCVVVNCDETVWSLVKDVFVSCVNAIVVTGVVVENKVVGCSLLIVLVG